MHMGINIRKYLKAGGVEKKKRWETPPTNVMGIMVARESPAARLKSNLKTDINAETNMMPPPIPIPVLERATKNPSRISFILTGILEMSAPFMMIPPGLFSK